MCFSNGSSPFIGHIYVACPPLYKLTFSRGSKSLGNSEQYFYDQNELDSYLKTLPIDAKYQLQRFKGKFSQVFNALTILCRHFLWIYLTSEIVRFGRNDAYSIMGNYNGSD